MKITHGKIPKVLLLGNGINRAYDYASWEELIKSISTKTLTPDEKEAIKAVPYPLQSVILTADQIDTQMKKISESLSAEKASPAEEELLRQFAMLPMDAILTTNYSYELEKALIPDFHSEFGKVCRWRNVAYEKSGKYDRRQLHTYFSADGDLPTIWHVHGEAARPDTMILGHYFYGKLLAKMQKSVSNIIRRYKGCQSRKKDFNIRSWLEYFLIGDVHIVGCGMALSEMDLWWIVNCKKRNFPDSRVVLYKPDIHPEEHLLADAYGVEVETGGLENDDFRKYYEWICEQLKNA